VTTESMKRGVVWESDSDRCEHVSSLTIDNQSSDYIAGPATAESRGIPGNPGEMTSEEGPAELRQSGS